MVNEQNTQQTQLEQLIQEYPDLLTDTSQPWQLVQKLLVLVKNQESEIQANNQQLLNYQNQVQGLQTKLARNKPKRLSLQEDEVFFTSLSPQLGSVGSNLPSPFRTPATPTIPELDNLSNLVEQRENEIEKEASQVIADLKNTEEILRQELHSLRRKLAQKEALITSFETERQEQTQVLTQFTDLKVENTKLQTELQIKEDYVKKAEKEAEQTNTDFLLAAEKVEVLQAQVKAVTNDNVELQHYLNEVSQERDYLKRNQKKTKEELLEKTEELIQVQQSTEEQKKEIEEIFLQREQAYERIRQEREIEFQKQLDNLRLFQNNESNNKSKTLKRLSLHTRSLSASLPGSGRSTPNSEKGYIIFPNQPSPKFQSGNLSAELGQQGFSEQNGTISPVESDFDQAVKRQSKRSSTLSYELLINQGDDEESTELATDKPEDAFTDLMSTVDSFQSEPSCNLEEHGALLEEKQALEASAQELNAQLLDWKENKSKQWQEELGQVKYELAEVQASKGEVTKELQTTQDKIRELENLLTQRESELSRQNEGLQDELAMVKNERDSQQKVVVDLVDKLEEAEKQLTEPSSLINLLEIKNFINTDLAHSMKEIEEVLGLENKILVESK